MEKLSQAAWPALGVLLFLSVWSSLVVFGVVDDTTLPAPWDIAQTMVTKSDLLLPEFWFSLTEVALAVLITLVTGVVLGIVIVDFKWAENVLYPVLVSTQVVPKIAFGPILLVWLGFGASSKVAMAVLIAFFPIVLSTVLGLQSVSKEKWELVRTMGAPWWRILVKVRLPAAIPHLISGVKLAVIFSITGVIVGEFVGSDRGIGRAVLQASAAFNTEIVFAATGYVVILGLCAFFLLSAVETVILRRRGGGIR
jgi:NitT/TauT family transport system permease protein